MGQPERRRRCPSLQVCCAETAYPTEPCRVPSTVRVSTFSPPWCIVRPSIRTNSSLLGKVWAIAGGGGADLAVVDIGAGNGCLALIAYLALDAQAVLVDHTLPRGIAR